MISKISTALCFLLCIVVNPNSGLAKKMNIANSILTIGTYKSETCGLINSSKRNIYDDTEPEDTIAAQIRKHIEADNVGTGFIYQYNDKKYVITCEHVILKAGKIRAYDSAFRAYELRLVGGDTFYDMAVW